MAGKTSGGRRTPARRKYGRAKAATPQRKSTATSPLFPGVDLDKPLWGQPNASVGIFVMGDPKALPQIIGANLGLKVMKPMQRGLPAKIAARRQQFYADIRRELGMDQPAGRGGPGAGASARVRGRTTTPKRAKPTVTYKAPAMSSPKPAPKPRPRPAPKPRTKAPTYKKPLY